LLDAILDDPSELDEIPDGMTVVIKGPRRLDSRTFEAVYRVDQDGRIAGNRVAG
jgi:hypothetical protein